MEFLGLIVDGCPRCKSSIKAFAIIEPVTGKGGCITITLRCNKCLWDREKHVKLSLMIRQKATKKTAKKTINLDTLSHNARKTAGL